jgi:hypothetical protein
VGCVRYRNGFREIWQAQLLRSPAEAYSTGAAASGAGRGSRVLGPARVVGFIDLAETVARLPDQLLDGGACVGIRREFEHGVVALAITLQFVAFLHKPANGGPERRVSES